MNDTIILKERELILRFLESIHEEFIVDMLYSMKTIRWIDIESKNVFNYLLKTFEKKFTLIDSLVNSDLPKETISLFENLKQEINFKKNIQKFDKLLEEFLDG